VTRVSHLVHESQGRVSKRSFKQVILDKNDPSGDTNCLPKQDHRLSSVMEYVNKHYNIKAACVVWYRSTIECPHGDRSICAQADVDRMDGDVWSLLSNESSKAAITTTNVKHAGIPRY
jgi:hypothetical protein